MFEALLEAVHEKMGDLHLKISPEQHQVFIGDFLPWLSVECEPLIGASRAVFGKQVFNKFEIGLEYSRLKPDEDGLMSVPIDIGCLYVRRKLEDRRISVNCNIYRCNISRRHNDPASINIELDICGDDEKKAFEELYKNYRRPIQRLLDDNKVEFFTSYCSGIVGKYKGSVPSIMLEEYFSDPDGESDFSFSKNFIETAEPSEAIKVFLLFSALFLSCHGYLEKPKNIDRFSLYERKLA